MRTTYMMYVQSRAGLIEPFWGEEKLMWLFFHSEKVIASTIIDFIVNINAQSCREFWRAL